MFNKKKKAAAAKAQAFSEAKAEAIPLLQKALEYEKQKPTDYIEYACQSWRNYYRLKGLLQSLGIKIEGYETPEKPCFSFIDDEGCWCNPSKEWMRKYLKYPTELGNMVSAQVTPYGSFVYWEDDGRKKAIIELDGWIKQLSQPYQMSA